LESDRNDFWAAYLRRCAPADGTAALHTLAVDDVLTACLRALPSPPTIGNRFSDQERIAWAG